MHPLVTYSILALCAAAFALGFYADGRPADDARWKRARRASLPVQLGALAVAYFTLRPGRGVDGHAAVASAQASRRAVLLELYSNY